MSKVVAVTLDDKYIQPTGEVFLSGMQALVRACLLQAQFDRAAGRNTAGFVSGYRGSPVGGLDREMQRAASWLEPAGVLFKPGLNEDLAATACWGTQQVGLFPGARHDGVFALWYGKNPGLDRSMDAIRHATHWGTSALGGVLAVVGDDHLAKSSAFGHQSEYAFADCLMPVLAPADLDELLILSLFGWALSRHCGAWTGFKLAGSICEGSASVRIPVSLPWQLPADFQTPEGDVHIRWPDEPGAIEHRARSIKLPAAQALVRAAGVDRTWGGNAAAQFGILAAGRAFAELRQALRELDIDIDELAAHGLRIHKPALVWPLEPQRTLAFVRGLSTVLVVEDKRPLLEDQLKILLYERMRDGGPVVVGKRDEQGAPLLPETGEIAALELAEIIGRRLGLPDTRLAAVRQRRQGSPGNSFSSPRTPYFCAGCPHNTSTVVPEDSVVIGGIGCHTLAMGMDRGICTFSHMGGEGATWIGIQPFSDLAHVFQNIGDGTYQHSGSMGIRAALAAGSTITFKLLFNDAVAMTGGQAVEGNLTVPRITRQLAAEGVSEIVVVSDEPDKYRDPRDHLAKGVSVRHRDTLDSVQRRLRAQPGVSVLIYDQTCAAEKRRRRKRGRLADPARHVMINELVCEGCGDCSVQSNCLAVVPVETPFGRRRQIDPDACNKDFSCLKGFCPSFVTIEGGRRRRPVTPPAPVSPPPPVAAVHERPHALLLAGIGGTGIVTLGAILGTAARMEGLVAVINDVTGMAQKGGPVLGHVQVAARHELIGAERIVRSGADVLLAADLVVANMPDAASRIGTHTRVLANTDVVPTGEFPRDPDARIDAAALTQRLRATAAEMVAIPALDVCSSLQGGATGAGVLMLGMVSQQGWLAVRPASIEAAIRLNGVAVEANLAAFAWGRALVADPERLAALVQVDQTHESLEKYIERRAAFLANYQNDAYADRYRELLLRVRGAETAVAANSEALTRAVAQSAFRLMAYKDEYEVARLHCDARFRENIATQFEGEYRVHYHLAPPLLARSDPTTGHPVKREFGPWMGRLMPLLARLRGLRGTPLDPFGWTAERRLERALVREYLSDIESALTDLSSERLAQATHLAALPQMIRGYGHIKAASIATFRTERAKTIQSLGSHL